MIDSNETIMRIVETTEEMLHNRRITEITVSEICEKAGVSRHTFYRYFKDKYDVSNWRMDQITENTLYFAGRTITLREAYVLTFYEFKKKSIFFRNTSFGEDYNSMPQFVIRRGQEVLLDTIQNYKHVPITKTLEFQIESFLYAGSYQIKKWIQNGMIESPEEFAELIISTAPSAITDVIDKGLDV